MTLDTSQPAAATEVLFEDRFASTDLDSTKWLRQYLPHWSVRERTRPSCEIRGGVLRLFIHKDQQPWNPEFDPGVRVSNLQTGHFNGPVGSGAGQHRFRKALTVKNSYPTSRLFVPRYCTIEMRARARLGPNDLAALWLIGFEEEPEESGEITVMEIFGSDVGTETTRIGHGIKPITDPKLRSEFRQEPVEMTPQDWHTYGIHWSPNGVRFFLDGRELSSTDQSPDYPMQIMLNLYALPSLQNPDGSDDRDCWFEIDFIRASAIT